ncbi:MAG: hypothetical protein ERJ67_01290 [Aphanocapsa feldmannii 277cV]|uniref:Uncharacterized protein n=1 Tax=Aphanocapsa feldmannii 277cV TaxID=2507553 RepID=A0A524RQU6_9CHRO|nr:MAG: hypothetical protein ERJ69_02670 [Aphanocapsa feldmannii 288cV]TGG96192.1 MAG: hypothetical protein ERJ67_01290 [Aphanocapsa feldmannii 277cV]
MSRGRSFSRFQRWVASSRRRMLRNVLPEEPASLPVESTEMHGKQSRDRFRDQVNDLIQTEAEPEFAD